MIKTLVFNVEGIADMQKILKIQLGGNPEIKASPVSERKRSLVEDIAKKYTNIKLCKISPEKAPAKSSELSPKPKTVKIEIVEEVILQKASPQVDKNSSKRLDQVHRSFMCISCSEKFQKFSQLEAHLKSCKTSSNQQFKCFCGKVLGSKKDLSNHVSLSHKENKQQHICTICKKVFTTLFNLQNHMMMHKSPHGTLKGIYMCHSCNSKFPDLQGLKTHRVNCKKKSIES